jgi:hypothetical protein
LSSAAAAAAVTVMDITRLLRAPDSKDVVLTLEDSVSVLEDASDCFFVIDAVVVLEVVVVVFEVAKAVTGVFVSFNAVTEPVSVVFCCALMTLIPSSCDSASTIFKLEFELVLGRPTDLEVFPFNSFMSH